MGEITEHESSYHLPIANLPRADQTGADRPDRELSPKVAGARALVVPLLVGVQRVAPLGVVGVAIALAVINLTAKHTLDVYPLVLVIWLVGSIQAIRQTRSVGAFIVATAGLLLLDSIVDIVSMGAWLAGLWWLLNQGAELIIRHPLIAEWRWDLGAETQITTYWTIFWGVGVPIRTAGLIASLLLARAERMSPERPITTRWLALPACLAAGTLVLYLGHVEDVIYFTLLGAPPFLMTTPLDFSYLAPTLGIVWNTTRVVLGAIIATAIAAVLFDVAYELEQTESAGATGGTHDD